MVDPYGSLSNPVHLSPWQHIVEVGWGGGWMVLTLDTPEPGLPTFNHGFFPIFPSGDWDPNVELLGDDGKLDKDNWAFLIEPDPYALGPELYHDESGGRDKILIWSFRDGPTHDAFMADCVARTGDPPRCEASFNSDIQPQFDDFVSTFSALGYDIEDVGSQYIIVDLANSVSGFPIPPEPNKDYPSPPQEIWADDKRYGPNPNRHRVYALKYETVDPGVTKRSVVRHCWLLNTVGGPPAFGEPMEISQSAGHDERLASYMNKYTLDKFSKDVKFRVQNGKFVETPPAEGQPSKLKGTIVKEVPYDQIGLVLKVSKGGFVE